MKLLAAETQLFTGLRLSCAAVVDSTRSILGGSADRAAHLRVVREATIGIVEVMLAHIESFMTPSLKLVIGRGKLRKGIVLLESGEQETQVAGVRHLLETFVAETLALGQDFPCETTAAVVGVVLTFAIVAKQITHGMPVPRLRGADDAFEEQT